MSLQNLIKLPSTLESTGLNEEIVIALVLKHLNDGGSLELSELSKRIKLAGSILEDIVLKLRKESRIRVNNDLGTKSVRYQLTDLGQLEANNALSKNGYLGPAPISLEHYTQLVNAQSVFDMKLTKKDLIYALSNVVVDDILYDQLGPALHSGKPILIYGQAGTGKTFICRQLVKLFADNIYLPYAIAVGREIIQYFDPLIHHIVTTETNENALKFAAKKDSRLLICQRPVATSGGELTMDKLELHHDSTTHISQAPIQMKANNGMYIIDDLGRQKMPPVELLNRWIVPMEEKHDYLSLSTGLQVPVPFNTTLIFSTNLHPYDLADETFLRRMGYKIHFESIDKLKYKKIWENIVDERGLIEEPGILEILFSLYQQNKRILLPCHPRDLIGIALDIAAFNDNKHHLTEKNIMLAWQTYFLDIKFERTTNE